MAKYDLMAMEYNPTVSNLYAKFRWLETPQGGKFWSQQVDSITDEGRAALAEMQAQWEQEQAEKAKPEPDWKAIAGRLAKALDASQKFIASEYRSERAMAMEGEVVSSDARAVFHANADALSEWENANA